MKEILFPVLSLGGLGLLFGLILGYASKKFAVAVDPKVPLIRECLPGANCGGCGFAGCDAYSEAVANGSAPPNCCPIGGAPVAAKIGSVLGIEVDSSEPKVAYVKCQGTCEKAKEKYNYYGLKDCREAMNVPGAGSKACSFGCLGYGSCVSACKFDAIEIVDGIAKVNKDNCVACGACVSTCPKNIIELVPKKQLVIVSCNSHDRGLDVKNICSTGCIGCGLCAKACPKEAITMENNLPVIDYSKCVNCGLCAMKCPTKAIQNFRKPVKKAAPVVKKEEPKKEETKSEEVKSEEN
ncbi:RnfABCDGE type electron transport complex subunit B [Clostridium novyi]|uniref:Ion-translocating oxidoreductase complex subunit B n=1 Tax=Clostridium novyi (strain NT) TaxID=386415 RepID=A0PZ63_CLONN|nr:Fe-S cluster domain-containing protein [Clostridium novyi]ABK61239.1 polyferredoxin [Clostridium novyi NT]KEH84826.1 ferredoxin [Clostridium novyi A str. NCTC 538]KEH84969.1 ferredoxin [Clostridium novyi A str. 4540]